MNKILTLNGTTPTTFNYDGTEDTLFIKDTGTYTIDTFGAQGGHEGGLGGELSADFQLDAGTELKIIIAGMGGDGAITPAPKGLTLDIGGFGDAPGIGIAYSGDGVNFGPSTNGGGGGATSVSIFLGSSALLIGAGGGGGSDGGPTGIGKYAGTGGSPGGTGGTAPGGPLPGAVLGMGGTGFINSQINYRGTQGAFDATGGFGYYQSPSYNSPPSNIISRNAVNPGNGKVIITYKPSKTDKGVDLVLTNTDSLDPVKVGQNLTYTLSVFNNSDNAATNVKLTDFLRQGANVVSSSLVSSSITPTDSSNNILTFDLGTLAAKGTKKVDITITPTQVGQIVNFASVGAKETDLNNDDNTIQQQTEVNASSVYQFSSSKYDADGDGFKIVVDKTIYAEFLEGKIPDPNSIYKGGFKLDSLTPITFKNSKIETITEDISDQFLNKNEILESLKVTATTKDDKGNPKLLNGRPEIEITFDTKNLPKIGTVSQATLANLLGYTHFNWLQVIGTGDPKNPGISSNVDIYANENLNVPVADSGRILTPSGKFFDLLPGGNLIAFDWGSYYGVGDLPSVVNKFAEEEEGKGNSVTVEAQDDSKTKVTVTSGEESTYYLFTKRPDGIYTSYTSTPADIFKFYIDITASNYLVNTKGRGGMSSPSTLVLRDTPSVYPKSGEKTVFTTVLVGVDKDNQTSSVLGIKGETINWFSNYNEDIKNGGVVITASSLKNNISTTPLGTGGVEITNNAKLNELSPQEAQFFKDNGVNINPSNVNLSVVRTINPGTVDIGQDYTYTLKVTNNGSDPATQVVLTEALPSGVDFISATTTSPSLPSNTASVVADPNGLITAKLGTLKSGESALVNVTAKSKRSGTLYSATNVASNEDDSNVNDNFLVSSQVINFVPTGAGTVVNKPTISVTATDPEAAETLTGQPANPGRFTLTRTGDTTTVLAVNYTLAGTATNGKDYPTLNGTATFTAGSNTTTIDINPIDDKIYEGTETVILSLTANPAYIISSAPSPIVNIIDNDVKTPQLTQPQPNFLSIEGGTEKSFLKLTKIAQEGIGKNEAFAFVVDDEQGRIGGIMPGTAGYLNAALDRSQVIFSNLGNNPLDRGFDLNSQRYLNFTPGDLIEFGLVADDSLDSVKAALAAGKSTPKVIFSLPGANANNSSQTKFTALPNNSGYQIAWANTLDDGKTNRAFNDMVLKVETLDNFTPPIGTNLQTKPEGAVLDLRNFTGQTLKVDTVSVSDAAYNNYIGFYAVEDTLGTLANGLKVGDAGYAEAAIKSAVLRSSKTESLSDRSITGGKIFAPVMVANGTFEDFLKNNPQNQANSNVNAYFNYLGANPDKVDHFRLLGDNKFGVEDLYGGGDRDYNDIVFQMTIES